VGSAVANDLSCPLPLELEVEAVLTDIDRSHSPHLARLLRSLRSTPPLPPYPITKTQTLAVIVGGGVGRLSVSGLRRLWGDKNPIPGCGGAWDSGAREVPWAARIGGAWRRTWRRPSALHGFETGEFLFSFACLFVVIVES